MYNSKIIYENIKKAWEGIGCKNAKQFSAYASDHNMSITEATISKWKKGAVPELDKLVTVCNLCNVDIDYLLGNNSCKTRVLTDIHTATGLDEEACKVLNERNVKPFNEDTAYLLSFLLKNGLYELCERIISDLEYYKLYEYVYSLLPKKIKDIFDKYSKKPVSSINFMNQFKLYYKTLSFMDIKQLTNINQQLHNNMIASFIYDSDDHELWLNTADELYIDLNKDSDISKSTNNPSELIEVSKTIDFDMISNNSKSIDNYLSEVFGKDNVNSIKEEIIKIQYVRDIFSVTWTLYRNHIDHNDKMKHVYFNAYDSFLDLIKKFISEEKEYMDKLSNQTLKNYYYIDSHEEKEGGK